MPRITRTLFIAGAGAAGAYFLDPDQGAQRRQEALAFLRSRGEAAGQAARHGANVAQGARHSDSTEPGELDDITLARKVESEIFRPADAPKGKVDVNVEDGVVFLRGELEDPERIEALVEAARGVAGVRDVKSLLHTPTA